ncbi:hypothetical protein B0H21DRAFT_693457 [Amylocystis lapponica]|nr:hypothetical protein B0H21DRAFT_693457 [Amylocystis lapponica]
MSEHTLALPPIDGTVSLIPGLLDFHAEHNPNHPMFTFHSTDFPSISFLEFAQATHRISHILCPTRSEPEGEIIAVLVHCDTVLYDALLVGIVRAGMVPFPMSHRNPPAAVASMLNRSNCHRAVVQPAYIPLVNDARTLLPSSHHMHIDALPEFADVLPTLSPSVASVPAPAPPLYPAPAHPPAPTDVLLYLHSSGSTGYPKPIPQTHETLFKWCTLPWASASRAHGLRWGAMALPPFHTIGLGFQLFAPLVSGRATALFAPCAPAPPIVPTAENTLAAARATQVNALLNVPTFVEEWAQHEDDVRFLATLQAMAFAGGPLSKASGAKLAAAGVSIYSIYGATELGILSVIMDIGEDATDGAMRTRTDWDWISFPSECNTRWVPQGDGTSELHLLTCATHRPSVENLENGEHGYATSDVFEPHPTKAGLWRIVGRLDDVIVLGTGEKSVPIPQEHHITVHRLVSGALMFGRGRMQVGVLVEPHPAHAVPAGDEKAVAEYRNAIWHQVEEANQDAPAFGKIFKEMILVAAPARPFERTAKGTIGRKKTLALYEEDIEALYQAVDASKDVTGIQPPPSWDAANVLGWLQEHVAVLNNDVVPNPSEDIFEHGFDSLSATFLRNHIIGALRAASNHATNAAALHIPLNFVYTHPTLAGLADAVAGLVESGSVSAKLTPVEQIEAMIAKYTVRLPHTFTKTARCDKDLVVVLTGSTGGLGSHLLAVLLQDARVVRVYALNRGTGLSERQRRAFDDACLPVGLLTSPKLVLLEAEFMQEYFGLEPAVLDEICSSATHIVHNAWKVDFNLSLSSFESQIATSVRLLCLAPGARFVFTSSVSVAMGSVGVNSGPMREEPLHEPELAAVSGYAESKYVVEEVLANARNLGMDTTTVRIGQICGSSQSGTWSTSEWLPSLVKSSISLCCWPALNGVVAWIPVDVVAHAMVDVMTNTHTPALVNFVHPHPVPWAEVLDAMNHELDTTLPCLPLENWVRKLEDISEHASVQDLEDIVRNNHQWMPSSMLTAASYLEQPALKLLQYFRDIVVLEGLRQGEDLEVGGIPRFETSKAQSVSPILANLRRLGAEDAKAWIQYWRVKAFIA